MNTYACEVKRVKKIAFITILAVMIMMLTGCPQPVEEQGSTSGNIEPEIIFDTVVGVTLPEGTSNDIQIGVIELMKQYEQLFDKTNQSGQVYSINNALGKAVSVDISVIDLINKLKETAEQTEGSFDPSIGALTELWASTGITVPPGEAEIQSAMTMIGYQNIVTDDKTVTVPAGMQLDLDSASQGYTADKAVEYLKSYGVTGGRIDIGGNVRTFGTYEGDQWEVEISTYVGENKHAVGIARVTDMAIVTTSIFDRYFEYDGKVYHSVIDPATGYPADNGVFSVTVLAENGWYADALSKACLVMGDEKGIEFINGLEGVEAVFVMEDGEVILSEGMGTKISFTQQQVVG